MHIYKQPGEDQAKTKLTFSFAREQGAANMR